MNRALALTPEGQALLRTTTDVLARLRETTAGLHARRDIRALTVSTTVSFASLWLVPRLQRWRALHPELDVHIAANDRYVDLERDRIDLAVRFCEPRLAPEDAIRLDEEVVFPVCSPKLLRDKRRPLKRPEDLARHVLLNFEDAGIPLALAGLGAMAGGSQAAQSQTRRPPAFLALRSVDPCRHGRRRRGAGPHAASACITQIR